MLTHRWFIRCLDGTVCEMDTRTLSKLKSHDLKSSVTCMCSGQNDNHVLARCMNSTLRLLDLHASEILHEYKGHQCESSKIDCGFYNLRSYVIGGSEDSKVFFWNPVNARLSTSRSFTAHASVLEMLETVNGGVRKFCVGWPKQIFSGNTLNERPEIIFFPGNTHEIAKKYTNWLRPRGPGPFPVP